VPAALLRSRRFRIEGSGAGATSLQRVMQEIPRYLDLLASGQVTAPIRSYPLADITAAWEASAVAGERVVVTS
jgi:hypothetical protein